MKKEIKTRYVVKDLGIVLEHSSCVRDQKKYGCRRYPRDEWTKWDSLEMNSGTKIKVDDQIDSKESTIIEFSKDDKGVLAIKKGYLWNSATYTVDGKEYNVKIESPITVNIIPV